MQQNRLTYMLIVFLGLLGQFATELYLPSMPNMARDLNVSLHDVQLTITVYVLGFSIGSLIYGTLSDKFGRKPIIFVCLAIGLVGSILCCLSYNIELLFLGRFIQGLGFSGTAVVSRSITKDISPDQISLAKLASLLGILNSVAIAFAPVIGGYIEKYLFWRISFVLLLVLTIIVTLMSKSKLEETNKNKRHLTFLMVWSDYKDVMTNRDFLVYNLISSLTLAGVISYQTVSSLLLQVLVGMPPDSFGYTAVFVTGALILGSMLNRYLMPKYGMQKMITFGGFLYLGVGLFFMITGAFGVINLYIILIPMMIYMFGAGVVYPNCSSGAMSIFDTKAGTAASVYNFFQMIGATIGSGIISTTTHKGQLPLGILLAVVGLVGLAGIRLLDNQKHYRVVK